MCQALSEGGRRCPVHRRDSIAVMFLARQESTLPADVVESLFTELRREGRNLSVSGLANDSYESFVTATSTSLTAVDGSAEYVTIFNERTNDEAPPADTLYALQRLRGAAASRSAALNAQLSTIADSLGIAPAVARQRYDALRASVDTSRGSETPTEYTAAAQQAAFDADLPHDRASVVALARLSATSERETEPRCVSVDLNGRSVVLHSGGYDVDGGRMEIRLSGEPERTYAYRNVPEDVWTRISETSDDPILALTEVRYNGEYHYSSHEEAVADAHRTRCAACGQFASSSHFCPERRVVAIAESMGETLSSEEASLVAESDLDGEVPTIFIEALVTDVTASRALASLTDEDSVYVYEDSYHDLYSHEYDEYDDDSDENVDDDSDDDFPFESHSEEVPPRASIDFERPTELPGGYSSYYRRYTPEEAEAMDALADDLIARLNRGDLDLAPVGTPIPVDGADLTSFSFSAAPEEVVVPSALLQTNRYQLSSYMYSDVIGVPEDYPNNYSDTTMRGLTFCNPQNEETHFVAAIPISQLYENAQGAMCVSGYYGSSPFEVIPPRDQWASARVSRDARDAAQAAYEATPDGQIVREHVYPNVTRTRTHAPTVLNAHGRDAIPEQAIQWASVRDTRRVLANDGGTLAARVDWSGFVQRNMTDQHGYAIDAGQFHVDGVLAITNDGGTLRTVSGAHELRCSCSRYRRTYHCTHVDYVRNNAPRMAAHMNVRPERVARVENTTPYAMSLINRRGFSYRTNEDGTHVGIFADVNRYGSARSRSCETVRVSELLRPDEVSTNGVTSAEQAIRAYDASYSNVSMSRSAPVLSALRRGSVEMSVGGSIRDIDETSFVTVSGSVLANRDESGSITVGTHTLRCQCGRFASSARTGTGTCPHIMTVAQSVQRQLQSDASSDTSERQFASNSAVVDARRAHEYERTIRSEMTRLRSDAQYNGETVDEDNLRQSALDAMAAREAEREAERVRWEERRLAREAEDAERRRIEALSYEERAVYARQRHIEERQSWLASNAEFSTNLEAYRAAREEVWSANEEGYGENLAQARRDIEEAVTTKDAGGAFLEPLTENVTDGICDPNVPGSRRFGVELEFDFPSNVDRDSALSNIVRELKEAGLTEQDHIGGYHSGRRSGWSKWNLEQDSTVSGELVSPLMSDSPEDWEQMKTALEVLKRNGAKATLRTGSHVHISTGSYIGSVAKHAELIRTVQDHQDVLYRAAANPKRGTHRGTRWCGPNVTIPSVSVNADDPSGLAGGVDEYSHNGHGFMMNLEATVRRDPKAHAEFRMWDASLDLAVIQQQVATSAALADYADRRVQNSGESPGRPRPSAPPGVSQGGNDVSDDALKNAVELTDKIFRRQSDRKRFMALFGVNKWSQ